MGKIDVKSGEVFTNPFPFIKAIWLNLRIIMV